MKWHSVSEQIIFTYDDFNILFEKLIPELNWENVVIKVFIIYSMPSCSVQEMQSSEM